MFWRKSKPGATEIPSTRPTFVDGKVVVCRWTHPEGKRRVFLLARSDGLFGRWGEYFSQEEFEMCWVPDDMGGSFYDSKETAVREIYAAYPWAESVVPDYLDQTNDRRTNRVQ